MSSQQPKRRLRTAIIAGLGLIIVSWIGAGCAGLGDIQLVDDAAAGSTVPTNAVPTSAVPTSAVPTTVPPTAVPTTAVPTTAVPTTIDPLRLRIEAMTVEAKVGQLLMPLVPGTAAGDVADPASAAALVADFQLGGVLYLGPNVANAAQLTAFSQGLQAHSANGIGLLVSIDQEGGRVTRVTDGVTALPSARSLTPQGADIVEALSFQSGAELSAQGINMVLAPVADLVDGNAGVIGNRSYSSDPAVAAEMVAASVRGLQASGAAAVAKHWPGHGATSVDSHQRLPSIDVDLDGWRQRERVPFAAAVQAGVSGVMVGHLAFPAIDPSGQPATVSPLLIEELLRQELGFEGLVITDALDMGAVASQDKAELAVQAVEAGVDILLATPDVAIAQRGLLDAVDSGRIPMARLDESVWRILRLKERLGLLTD